MKDALSIVYALFVVGSLLSRMWQEEAAADLRRGVSPTSLRIGSWVQASWLYGAPSWFFWGWEWAFVIWAMMGTRLMAAIHSAQATTPSASSQSSNDISEEQPESISEGPSPRRTPPDTAPVRPEDAAHGSEEQVQSGMATPLSDERPTHGSPEAAVLRELPTVVAAVREHHLLGLEMIAIEADAADGTGPRDEGRATRAHVRWRSAEARVVEAQTALYKRVLVWNGLPSDEVFNRVVLPALQSGQLVSPQEPHFSLSIVAAFRACEAAAREANIDLAPRVPPTVLSMITAAGDTYQGSSDGTQPSPWIYRCASAGCGQKNRLRVVSPVGLAVRCSACKRRLVLTEPYFVGRGA